MCTPREVDDHNVTTLPHSERSSAVGPDSTDQRDCPYQAGGNMAHDVELESGPTHFAESAWKFEARTPNVPGSVGLAAAIEFLESLDRKALWKRERELTRYALSRLQEVKGQRILGPTEPKDRVSIFSFVIEDRGPGCRPGARRDGRHCSRRRSRGASAHEADRCNSGGSRLLLCLHDGRRNRSTHCRACKRSSRIFMMAKESLSRPAVLEILQELIRTPCPY